MPGTPQSSLPDLAIGDDLLRSSGVLHARGRAGFVLANGAKRGHSCSMKMTEDVHKYVAEQGVSKEESLKKRMEAKLKESAVNGVEFYAKA